MKHTKIVSLVSCVIQEVRVRLFNCPFLASVYMKYASRIT